MVSKPLVVRALCGKTRVINALPEVCELQLTLVEAGEREEEGEGGAGRQQSVVRSSSAPFVPAAMIDHMKNPSYG